MAHAFAMSSSSSVPQAPTAGLYAVDSFLIPESSGNFPDR